MYFRFARMETDEHFLVRTAGLPGPEARRYLLRKKLLVVR